MPEFLDRIRRADDQTKKRWLVFLTAVIMLGVISVWLKHFNSLVLQPSTREAPVAEKFSFADTMKAGTRTLWSKLTATIEGFGRTLNSPRSYIIKPE